MSKKEMNEHQQTAIDHPCRLAVETLYPKFHYVGGTHDVVLTV